MLDSERDVSATAPTVAIAGLFLVLLFAALAALFVALQADREALLQAVQAERLEQVDNVVRLIEEDVDDVVDDLDLVARVIAEKSDAAAEPVMLALLARGRAYRVAGVYGPTAADVSYLSDPRRSGTELRELYPHMETIAVDMRESKESLRVSSTIAVGETFYRVFGRRAGEDVVVVLVVETTAWLTGLRHVSSDPLNRVLVIGPAGGVAPASDPAIRAASQRSPEMNDSLRVLLRKMRAGERGTVRGPRSLAREIGLDDGEVVVAYAPIRLRDQDLWSLATFTSIAALRAQERALVVRFAVASVVIALLLMAFAAYAVVATRRYTMLRERLVHAAEMAEVNAQLIHAEKLATVGGLAAGIAHEIGTPLGVVRGRAEYVLKNIGDDDPLARSLTTITEQIDRVSKIIRELLDFARPRPAMSRATDLRDVCEKVAELLEIEFDQAGIELKLEIPDDLPPIAADPDRLQQVLVNLLVNARDACSAGDTVVIRATPVGDNVEFEVSDDGPGVPEEHVNQVFDPFFTSKKRGHGTGLGLSVVSQITRAHGGEVELESTIEEGTTVRLRWPTIAGTKSV